MRKLAWDKNKYDYPKGAKDDLGDSRSLIKGEEESLYYMPQIGILSLPRY